MFGCNGLSRSVSDAMTGCKGGDGVADRWDGMIDGSAPAGLLSSTVPFTMLLAVGIPLFVFDLLALWAWVRASVQAHNTAVELGSTKKQLQEYKQVYTIDKMQQLEEYSQRDNTPAGQQERRQRRHAYKQKVLSIYAQYNPSLGEEARVDTVLQQQRGREEELITALESKYGPAAPQHLDTTPPPSNPLHSSRGADGAGASLSPFTSSLASARSAKAQLERGGSGTSSASETPSGAALQWHREVAANGEKGNGMFLWPARQKAAVRREV